MDAMAYIDPGSGSLAIQAALAALVAGPYFLRRHIAGLIDRLRRPASASAQKDGAITRDDDPT